jgi:hypothetical protein
MSTSAADVLSLCKDIVRRVVRYYYEPKYIIVIDLVAALPKDQSYVRSLSLFSLSFSSLSHSLALLSLSYLSLSSLSTLSFLFLYSLSLSLSCEC